MSEEQEQLDPVERLRLQVEEIRLKFDHLSLLNEKTRTFLQRWQTDVLPVHESGERSREMAATYAQMTIKTMFLLNGGALIVFPAFAELIDTPLSDQILMFVGSIGSFVLGLALIAITSLLAYMSLDADAAGFRCDETIIKINLNQGENPKGHDEEQENNRTTAKTDGEKLKKLAVRLTRWAIGLGLGSLGAFLVGTGLAIAVLTTVTDPLIFVIEPFYVSINFIFGAF